jgi:hypothetical protein
MVMYLGVKGQDCGVCAGGRPGSKGDSGDPGFPGKTMCTAS